MAIAMNHEEAVRFWNANADTWTKLARAGYDVYRDYLNTPAFFRVPARTHRRTAAQR
jgi:hypothetical protein